MITAFGTIRLENEKRKVMLQCNAKAYQSIIQNPIALETETYFNNSPDYISNLYRKTWCRQKWKSSSDSWSFQSRQILSQRKKAYSEKHPKVSPFDIKSVSESYGKRFRDTKLRRNFNLKAETQIEKTHSKQWCNLIHQHNEITKYCIQVLSFMSEQQLTTKSKTCMHLKNFKSFLVFAGQKQISGKSRCNKKFNFYHSKHNYCGKRSRTSKNN